MRIFCGIQPPAPRPGQLHRRDQSVRRHPGAGRSLFLHRRPTLDHDRVRAEELREATLYLAALLFATGLDPERSTVFAQSHVTAHPEAAWLLGSVTSFGELRRMTQFKEKGEQQEFVSAGLFTYPVLRRPTSCSTRPTWSRSATTSASTSSSPATSPSGSTRASARPSRAGGSDPRGRRPDQGPAGARARRCRRPAARRRALSGVLDPPETIRKKFKTAVTDSGSEVRHDPRRRRASRT